MREIMRGAPFIGSEWLRRPFASKRAARERKCERENASPVVRVASNRVVENRRWLSFGLMVGRLAAEKRIAFREAAIVVGSFDCAAPAARDSAALRTERLS
jgi:hypothetical protein